MLNSKNEINFPLFLVRYTVGLNVNYRDSELKL